MQWWRGPGVDREFSPKTSAAEGGKTDDFCLQSYFWKCKIRIHIWNTESEPDPPSCWKRIQVGSGSVQNFNFQYPSWPSSGQHLVLLYNKFLKILFINNNMIYIYIYNIILITIICEKSFEISKIILNFYKSYKWKLDVNRLSLRFICICNLNFDILRFEKNINFIILVISIPIYKLVALPPPPPSPNPAVRIEW